METYSSKRPEGLKWHVNQILSFAHSSFSKIRDIADLLESKK